jgi:hypothetical protein
LHNACTGALAGSDSRALAQLAPSSQLLGRIMDDTLLVRRMELRPPRQLTQQFSTRQQSSAIVPLLAVIAVLAIALLGKPVSPDHGRLAHEANEVLRLLP